MHVLLLLHRVIRNLAVGNTMGAVSANIVVRVAVVAVGGSRVAIVVRLGIVVVTKRWRGRYATGVASRPGCGAVLPVVFTLRALVRLHLSLPGNRVGVCRGHSTWYSGEKLWKHRTPSM